MASLGRGVMNRRSGDRRINLLVALSTGLTPRPNSTEMNDKNYWPSPRVVLTSSSPLTIAGQQ